MITMDANNKYIRTKDSVKMYSGASAILSNATMLFLKVLQNEKNDVDLTTSAQTFYGNMYF